MLLTRLNSGELGHGTMWFLLIIFVAASFLLLSLQFSALGADTNEEEYNLSITDGDTEFFGNYLDKVLVREYLEGAEDSAGKVVFEKTSPTDPIKALLNDGSYRFFGLTRCLEKAIPLFAFEIDSAHKQVNNISLLVVTPDEHIREALYCFTS